MGLVTAKCSMCGSSIDVDDSQEKGVCEYCGTEFVTEKIVNVTNVTKVDKSTNIYYGETTDAKIKKDLNKAYKSLKMAGYDYENLKLEGNSLDPVMCKMACMLARGMTKSDPTNYDGWRLTALMYYIAYTQRNCEWLYPEGSEASKQGLGKVLKDALKIFNTAKKAAPNIEEKSYIELLESNVKIKYYKAVLPQEITDERVSKNVEYKKKPQEVSFKNHYFVSIFLLLGIAFCITGFVAINSIKDRYGFNPEYMNGPILFIIIGIVCMCLFFVPFILKEIRLKTIIKIDAENKQRFNDKKAEIKAELAAAKTLKDYEDFATKYGIPKI